MEVPSLTIVSNYSFLIGISVFIALVIGFIAYSLLSRSKTVPSGSKEGFQGPKYGVATIPCGQESSHVTNVLEIFAKKSSSTGDGSADMKEFKEIMSKLCCIKHDLMGTAQVVQSTLNTPYNNTHDRENPADTVARCFTKSIPIRDLDIAFGTWKHRGNVLLNRLCTSYKLNNRDTETAIKHFAALWLDVFDIAKTSCLAPEKAPEYGSPRDPRGFIHKYIEKLGAYTGYY